MGKKTTNKIEKISVNGNLISEPQFIAEEFNSFFISIGSTISESVRPTTIDPLDLMPTLPNVVNMEFATIGPSFLCDLVKTFESKSSCDLDF